MNAEYFKANAEYCGALALKQIALGDPNRSADAWASIAGAYARRYLRSKRSLARRCQRKRGVRCGLRQFHCGDCEAV